MQTISSLCNLKNIITLAKKRAKIFYLIQKQVLFVDGNVLFYHCKTCYCIKKSKVLFIKSKL